MRAEPPFLSTFSTQAKALLAAGAVGEIEFSGPTYQVEIQVKDEDDIWVFLQFSHADELQDSFCSCAAYDDANACEHLAAAYMRVTGEEELLHRRFEASFWGKLGRAYALLFRQQEPSKSRGAYSWKEGPLRVQLKGTDKAAKQQLKQVLEEKELETEDNSIKFLNLPQKELDLWRDGDPSDDLAFELSPWGDLAKIFFLSQERGGAQHIDFTCDKRGLPTRLHLEINGIQLDGDLNPAILEALIPALDSVQSPLPILDWQKGELLMRYDPPQARLLIVAEEQRAEQPMEQVRIGDWCLIPAEGFVRSVDRSLLERPIIRAGQMERFLDEHWETVRSSLEEWTLHTDVRHLHYELLVSAEEGICCTAYLESPGDLEHGHTRLFGSWLFVDTDGFYRVTSVRFMDLKTRVAYRQVPGFLLENRTWLNNIDGFRVHLSTVEATLHYEVDADGSLCFTSQLALHDESDKAIDLGEWVFLPGSGFFAKRAAGLGLSLRGGMCIPADEVAAFIRAHRNEVEQVSGFFCERSPVASVGIRIHLTDMGAVLIEPHHQLRDVFDAKDVVFYGDFVYLRGEGFHATPLDQRIPERFRQRCVIPANKLPVFLSYELDDLRPYATDVDPKLRRPYHLALNVDSLEVLEERQGNFELSAHYASEHGQVSVGTLMHAMEQGQRYVVSPAGIIDLEQSRFDWLQQLAGEGRGPEDGTIVLSVMELLRLHAFEDLLSAYHGNDREMHQRIEKLTQLSCDSTANTRGLKSRLRAYQKVGVEWLWFLYKNKLSGLLCDDMGLGKTHQAMALMAAVKNEIKRPAGRGAVPPSILVVCPTSVLYHWEDKLAEFLPKLRVYTYYGTRRSLDDLNKKRYDVLLTSYGVLRIDREALGTYDFALAIYDETQVAKNHSSRIHQALLRVRAGMRLGLSGTPIENRLRELKALFDVVLPGYMPSESHYRDFFVNPIEKTGDEARKALLSAYVKPFILRRRKVDVLDDLPRKTEELGRCDLYPDQSQLYEEVLSRTRKQLFSDLEAEAKPVPYIHIFAALTHLKQICNHPAVFQKDVENYQNYASGKWNLFKELLNEALDSEQKVVVFSQYLSMLDIMERYLSERGIGFASVRGSTRDRREQLKRFNTDPKCTVFLGSLQAVGVGVDLTAASVVIHYDRWWNPAKENQATDRVHRIGQTRGVQVFKLVTMGTVEERIDALIAQKGKLAEDILGQDDEHLLKKLSRDQLMDLFSYVPQHRGGG
jgi:superfamily II DNA or RNA helicase